METANYSVVVFTYEQIFSRKGQGRTDITGIVHGPVDSGFRIWVAWRNPAMGWYAEPLLPPVKHTGNWYYQKLGNTYPEVSECAVYLLNAGFQPDLVSGGLPGIDNVNYLAREIFEPAKFNKDDTFVFLNDVHANASTHGRKGTIKDVANAIHKQLDKLVWPEGCHFAGSPINPGAVFVNGDLTDSGGGGLPDPSWKGMGKNTREFADIFPSKFGKKMPVYINLGNHDTNNSGGGMWYDFYRDRMWWFIRQWIGLEKDGNNVIQYVTRFDAVDLDKWSGDSWKKKSCDYLVDTGGVIYLGLHRFGGDTDFGRASGLKTIKRWLQDYPSDTGIIIHQHYGWDRFSEEDRWWTEEERDAMMEVFDGRNVIGIFHGHIHTPVPYYYTKTIRNREIDLYSPGATFQRRFGVARIKNATLDVAFYEVEDDESLALREKFTKQWKHGLSPIASLDR